ncbi:hypothetical protein FQV39_28750 [Bosea sp. F3-2]|uniref:hypothetical protein n=1 Tax=Bosea sp. F3-2 TaxID=2599640 RepID=UPI0011EF3037|nr:hypothetical protein [Bosea sp. F3-2]QEL26154.1 hypothetical protein FQV39_28750 [Bosea sp. F3-2]
MSAAPAPRREDLPDGSVRIFFAAPIVDHGQAKGHLTLRQPTAGEIWELGDPRGFIYDKGGLGTPYVDRPLLLQWIRKLITEHDADVVARERDPSLGLLIEEAVLDFFRNARMRLKPASAPSPVQA